MNKQGNTSQQTDNKPDYEQYLRSIYKVSQLVTVIEGAKIELLKHKQDNDKQGFTTYEDYEYMIDTVAQDWEGIHIPSSIVQSFSVLFPEYEDMDTDNIDDDEWVWDTIDSVMSKLSRALESLPEVKQALGEDFSLSYANMSNCGDYGLILYLVNNL